jgi:hypothetical protein
MAILLVTTIALPACAGGDKDTSAETDSAGDADTDTDTDVDTDTPEAEVPVVTAADAWCYFHETGEQFYNWDAECTVTDPQGTGSLENGRLVIVRDAVELAVKVLACDRDAGVCRTTFREDAEGVLCAEAAAYTFRFTVTDEDDNTSEPVEVPGRAQ